MVERFIGNPAQLSARLHTELMHLAAGAAAAHRRWSLAVSGGSVATAFFPEWGTPGTYDWAAADVFWADERAVAPTDPDSNYGVARTLWLDPAQVPSGSVHRMPADAPDLTAAAASYADDLRRAVGDGLVLDLVLLGIGPDGHVASLFPGHPLLEERERAVAPVTDSPKPPPRRMTLTMPVLTRARLVVIGAFGASKADIVREAIEDPASRLPAAIASRGASRALWMLDEASASRLDVR